ncbi:hypothetical protein GCM10020220_060250 [Nonomuraea rubra]|uniref:hypothetical protein n=1 Tax=Nonomuraea rubra TaxID=46180 RepID=UPI0031E70044
MDSSYARAFEALHNLSRYRALATRSSGHGAPFTRITSPSTPPMYASRTPGFPSSAGYSRWPSAPNDRSQISSGRSRSPDGSGSASSSASPTRNIPASPRQTCGPV